MGIMRAIKIKIAAKTFLQLNNTHYNDINRYYFTYYVTIN